MESSPAAVDRGPLSFFGFGATEDAPAAADEERSTPPPDPSRLTTCQPTLMPDMSEFEEKDGRATDWMPGGDSGSATTLDERVPIGPAKGGTGGGPPRQARNRRKSSVSKLVMQSYDETAKDAQVAAPPPAGAHISWLCGTLRWPHCWLTALTTSYACVLPSLSQGACVLRLLQVSGTVLETRLASLNMAPTDEDAEGKKADERFVVDHESRSYVLWVGMMTLLGFYSIVVVGYQIAFFDSITEFGENIIPLELELG